jgi:hypothetical protein
MIRCNQLFLLVRLPKLPGSIPLPLQPPQGLVQEHRHVIPHAKQPFLDCPHIHFPLAMLDVVRASIPKHVVANEP